MNTSDDVLKQAKALADEFEALEGRRPRMYLAGVTSDDGRHMKKILATVFADMGWDVDVGPEGDTADGAAQDASDNDVHMVGLFAVGDYEKVFREIEDGLLRRGRDDIGVFVFGDVTEAGAEALYAAGAYAAFGAEADIEKESLSLLSLLAESAREAGEG